MTHGATTDTEAEFDRLLAPHLASSITYARAITGNCHDAEDAVQEAVIKGLNKLSQFDQTKPFKPWWLTVLRNTCRDQKRAHRRWLGVLANLIMRADNRTAADGELHESVAEAINRLHAQHREILELKYLASCSYSEIAQVLQIPRGTVMSRLHAARKAFQRVYVGAAE